MYYEALFFFLGGRWIPTSWNGMADSLETCPFPYVSLYVKPYGRRRVVPKHLEDAEVPPLRMRSVAEPRNMLLPHVLPCQI